MLQTFIVSGPAWIWRAKPPAKGAWHFLTIDGHVAAEIRYLAFQGSNAFGSVRVVARIGATQWQTSLFRAGEFDGYLLPLKADVRRRERIEDGENVTAEIKIG
jgi:Domain of unknown function (DUF1905)